MGAIERDRYESAELGLDEAGVELTDHIVLMKAYGRDPWAIALGYEPRVGDWIETVDRGTWEVKQRVLLEAEDVIQVNVVRARRYTTGALAPADKRAAYGSGRGTVDV